MPSRSRRSLAAAVLVALSALAACTPVPGTAPPPTAGELPEGIAEIMDQAAYAEGRWGLSVVDLESGDVVLEHDPDGMFRTGSTAKILSVTAALDAFGADHRFETPVFATGEVVDGRLDGDLVLRGAGDLTLGGQRMADGTLDVPIFDDYDANPLPGVATLTPEDPLAGLDALAADIAAAGVRAVTGDVLVDDRLWEPVVLDRVPISPIVVNDNLVDFLITPGAAEGDAATFTWRPQTAAYHPALEVTTGPADSSIELELEAGAGGVLTVRGRVPLGADPVVWTYQVADPATWARTLFIEALGRAGVAVAADPLAANDRSALPAEEELDSSTPIAVFTSVPFSETARFINKVSHNLGANQLPLLLAVQAGGRTLEEGLELERAALERGGLTEEDVTVADGQGLPGNLVTPAGMTGYLRYLTTTPTFPTFYDSTPILGVDGSLASVLPEGDPAVGAAHAKTGTLVSGSPEEGLTLDTKALAGYLDARSGRRLAFAVFVNDVPITDVGAVFQANEDLGAIASQLYRLY